MPPDDERNAEPQPEASSDTPGLLVRSVPSDDGHRPLATGTPFWASPDIIVEPLDKWDRVQAGSDVSISVMVQNLGLDPATGVKATFWFIDPSTSMTPSPDQIIGTSAWTSIAAGQAALLTCEAPWRPLFLNGGHECLFAQVSCLADPVTAPFRPDLDRHVAQQNVTVFEPDRAFNAMLNVGNPFSEPAKTLIVGSTTVVRNAVRLLDAELPMSALDVLQHLGDPAVLRLLADNGLELEAQEPGAIAVEIVEGAGRIGPPLDTATQALLRLRELTKPAPQERVLGEFALAADDAVRIRVLVNPARQVGSATVHQIRQLSGDIDVGGYVVIEPPV